MRADKETIHVLSILRADARATLTHLKTETGIPVSTLHDRLSKTLPRLITKYTALLNYAEIGYRTRAWFLVKSRKDTRETFETGMKKQKCINTLVRTSGTHDYIIEGIFTELNELEKFLEILETQQGVKAVSHLFTLSDIAREEFTPQPQAGENANHKPKQSSTHQT
jgi:DNA-binding Lrp family transcriptional regulator